MKASHVDLEHRLAQALGGEREVVFARLFGSRADECARPDSDVDLAVLLSSETTGSRRYPALRHLEEILYERFPGPIFHLVDLATAPPLLQTEIMTRGRTLVSGPEGLEEELRLKALKLFFDAAPLHKARREKLASLATIKGGLMVRVEVVERKLEALNGYLGELEHIRPVSLDEYRIDLVKRRAVERLLQLVVEATTDINTHLAAESGQVPDDCYESFWSAAKIGAIDDNLARVLAPSAGLRNRLVHEYEALDDERVFASVDMALSLFPAYIRQIVAFLGTR